MADKKISQLNPLLTSAAGDLVAIVDISGSNETKRITVSNLMGAPGPIGNNIPNTGTFTSLELTTGPQVDEISTDTSLGLSNTILPTQKAIKGYVDNSIAGVVSSSVNPIHVSTDSTANAGDVVLVDTVGGNVSITMIETPKGKIIVKKTSADSNEVIVIPNTGTIDGNSYASLTTENESLSIITDTINFYIV